MNGAFPLGMQRSQRAASSASRGHTLLELVTVVALVAVAAALAYPALAGMRRGQDLESGAVDLLHTLRLAHWRAVTSGRRVRLAARRDADTRWRFLLEREGEEGWTAEGGERALPAGAFLAFTGPAAKVFNPDGTCSFGSISLRGPGACGYRLALAPATGRVRLYRGDREAGRAR